MMNFKNYKPLLNLFILSAVVYVLHKLAFYVFKINDQGFHYNVETLYLLFFAIASVLFIVLMTVKQKSFDNVGMAFLLGTSLQMVLCYLILRPILQDKIQNTSIEKTNFFITFILFLLIETVLTIRILNEKQ
ncbi:hypothetical protein OIU83_18820 [Flavobacterium sp. LS1R49]|uniref:Uncharacterized protein n=1 Tax=Flavobacterium shii TaxID=2987687 RepID=A0A9X2ZH88_9FLAO|nr:hypothetical protein [Flavobacterium shii]MCV9929722.1 hypothetical protein [Flavobacterium shii]